MPRLPGPEPSQALRNSATTILCLLILAFYSWTVATDGVQVLPDGTRRPAVQNWAPPGQFGVSYYNLLADSFLAGRLSLLIDPPKELLALSDPYEPKLNEGLRMHDVSLYNGKYYLYFGPTPALLFYIPFRALHLGLLPDALAVLVFASGGFLFSIALFRFLVRRYIPSAPFSLELLAMACLGLCNVVPYILRRPSVYEVAISCGYFFVSAALYFLFTGYGRGGRWRFLLAGILLALGIGARVTIGLAALLMFWVWLGVVRHTYAGRWKNAIPEFLALFAPCALAVFFLGYYNHLRFGSWAEVGMPHQLGGENIPHVSLMHVHNIIPGLYRYLLAGCRINFKFPLFHPHVSYPWKVPPGYMGMGPCTGLLPNFVVVWSLIFLPSVLAHLRDPEDEVVRRAMIGLTGLGLLTMLAISFLAPSSIMRYLVDFVPFILSAALLVWLFREREANPGRHRRLTRIAMAAAVLYTCFFSVCISLNGYYSG